MVRNATELEVLQLQDFISYFHVVLASASIHSEPKYAAYTAQASGRCGSKGRQVN